MSTKGQYMKELDTLAGNVAMKQPQREICLDTKRQYMKEPNILADIVTNNLLQRLVLQDIYKILMADTKDIKKTI